MPPLWYLLSLPDPAPSMEAAVASSGSSSARKSAASAMDRITQLPVSSPEIPADLNIRIGDTVFPLHKAVMSTKCGYIHRAIAAASKDADAAATIELDLSALPGGADAFEKAARYCYGANFEITARNAAALRCAAAFLGMDRPPADLARRVDHFLAQSALRSLPGAVAVLRSCDAAGGLAPAATEELVGPIARRAADAVALAVSSEALFPTRSPPGWWKAELAALSPAAFGKVVTALWCRRTDPAVVAGAAAAYAELALAEVLAAPRDDEQQRALLEAVVDVLPSAADAPVPAPLLCRLLHAAVATEASAKACRDLELRVAAVLDHATVEDLLGVALDAAGERVRNTDTVRRVITAFVERHAAVPESDRRSRRMSISRPELGAASAAALEKVARTVDEVAAEIATEEALPIAKFVGLAGAVPRDARPSHDALYRAVDVYLKTHPELDEIQREKVCGVMDPLKLSYQARLHAAQNRRLPLQAALSALYYDQLKLRSGGGDGDGDGRARAADEALARENEALRTELARMRACMSGMQRGKGKNVSGMQRGKGSGATPSSPSPAPAAKKVGFLGSVSRTLSRLNPFKGHHGGWTKDVEGIVAGGRHSKTMHHVVTPKRRRFSIS